jgi:hypothetical protein
VSVEDALDPGVRLTEGGFIAAVNPVAASDTPALRVTVPVNPELVIEHAAVAELPATKLAGDRATQAIVKSAPVVTVTVAV